MNFDDWLDSVPAAIKADSLWRMKVYQLAEFAADIGWHDVTKLVADKRTASLADQLYRALGSISANLAEGYSYSTGPNRARLYEYALGSAREARAWYFKGRHVLGSEVTNHRLDFIARIIQLLLVMIPDERGRTLKDETPAYVISNSLDLPDPDFDRLLPLDALLADAPLPAQAPARHETRDA
ncbi:MAG: four helix bundle protein [Candidatus Brachytrichaceae bacterium NZ_4S206]|jgi:four helix bundle protein